MHDPSGVEKLNLKAGEWVEVCSPQEILATLDEKGCLENMPFMPEMFAFCGQRFRVYKRAHKTCDTVFPVRGRRVNAAVHLETRCNGKAHGGCQAGCLIFWKEAWLKPIERTAAAQGLTSDAPSLSNTSQGEGCTEDDVWRAASSQAPGQDARYSCQATQLLSFTTPLKWWDARQYAENYTSGNLSLPQIAR